MEKIELALQKLNVNIRNGQLLYPDVDGQEDFVHALLEVYLIQVQQIQEMVAVYEYERKSVQSDSAKSG